VRVAWGKGYATEAAGAVVEDAFARLGVREVLAYTATGNARSQAMVARLGMRRDPSRDFDTQYGDTPWYGLIWMAEMRQGVPQV
jgi:RimJ/RimL family protein N-acetyltransferase